MSHANCASCACDITGQVTTGASCLYNPGPNGFLLCEECFLLEDELTDVKGTNNIPELLQLYTRNQPEGANDAVLHP